MFCQVVLPLFQFAPPASSLCLAGNSAFFLSRVLSLLEGLSIPPAYLFAVQLCITPITEIHFHTVYKFPTTLKYSPSSTQSHKPSHPIFFHLAKCICKEWRKSKSYQVTDKTSITIPVNAPKETIFLDMGFTQLNFQQL